jgi:hypothetical protein
MSLINKINKLLILSSLVGLTFLPNNRVEQTFTLPRLENKEIFIPEYKRELSNVFMKTDPSLSYQKKLILEISNYAKVNLVLPEIFAQNASYLNKELSSTLNPVSVFYFNSGRKFQEFWAQDLFANLVTSKDKKIIFPARLSNEKNLSNFMKMLGKDSLDYFVSENNFDGGDLIYDFFNNKNLIFTGDLSPFSNSLMKEELTLNYKKEFGADSVIFFHVNPNETPLFHLDQCFTFINSGKVALLNLDNYSIEDFQFEHGAKSSILEKKLKINYATSSQNMPASYLMVEQLNSSKKMLRDMKTTFINLGYEVIDFPASFWQIANYQSYMNSRIFFDDGKRKVLMPIFPNSKGIYDTNYFRNKDAKDFFEGLGLEVIPVENNSWVERGNIHCLINEI